MSRLYLAYGSNLNKQQMRCRCPSARPIGVSVIEDYRLCFKGIGSTGFATIEPCEGDFVPVGVWEIEPSDERSLDLYEGYPRHYYKTEVAINLDGESVSAMVYVMCEAEYMLPSSQYFRTVASGYRDFGMDINRLVSSLNETKRQIKRLVW